MNTTRLTMAQALVRFLDMQYVCVDGKEEKFVRGYHSSAVETNDPGTKWRVTPEKAGPSYVLGDVGTHALFLAETMVPDLKIEKLMCAPAELCQEPRSAGGQCLCFAPI